MPSVSKRELNQHTADVLDQVTSAQDVVVTERGEPRWRVTTYRADRSPLARMAREGRYEPPVPAPTPWPSEPGGPRRGDAEFDALLNELKGEH